MNNLLLKNRAKGPGATIYFCKVIRFNPSSNTVDVVTIDNNISLFDCSVTCSMPAAFSYGERYFPSHDDQNPEVEYVNSAGDIYCVAAFVENDYNNTAILGFLFPRETTLAISEYGLYIFRHESDVMWMVRGDGTMQIYHPSGSIIKIGDNNINEMTSEIVDGGLYPAKAEGMHVRPTDDYNANKTTNLFIKWYQGQEFTLDENGNVIVKTKNGDVVTAMLTMTPAGIVTIETTEEINAITKDLNVTASGNVVANVSGDMTANVSGDMTANVSGAAAINAPGSSVSLNANAVTIDAPDINLITTDPNGLKINGVPGVTATPGDSFLIVKNGIITGVY